jgi:hypothetical protein
MQRVVLENGVSGLLLSEGVTVTSLKFRIRFSVNKSQRSGIQVNNVFLFLSVLYSLPFVFSPFRDHLSEEGLSLVLLAGYCLPSHFSILPCFTCFPF